MSHILSIFVNALGLKEGCIKTFVFFLCSPNYPHTEGQGMRSVGITLNGGDPIAQQLQELDAQSKLLSGLNSFEELSNHHHDNINNGGCRFTTIDATVNGSSSQKYKIVGV